MYFVQKVMVTSQRSSTKGSLVGRRVNFHKKITVFTVTTWCLLKLAVLSTYKLKHSFKHD